MPGLNLRIGAKLAMWAGLSVVLVIGMLAAQQVGDRLVTRERAAADRQQLSATEALYAASDVRKMQVDIREIRLAIAPSEVDKALERLRRASGPATSHLDTAMGLTDDAEKQARLKKVRELLGSFVAAAGELAEAAKEYGDTDAKVQRAGKLGDEINALIEEATTAAMQAANAADAAAIEETNRVNSVGIGIGLFVIAMLGAAAVFGAVSVARPIRRIGEVLLALADGNKTVEVPYTDRRDEVGDNARAAEAFKQMLTRIERMETEQRQSERNASERRRADMQTLAEGFRSTIGSIVEAVSSASCTLEASANTLTKTAGTTQRLTATVSATSEETSANVQSVASATEQMKTSVSDIARHARQSSEIAAQAVKQAEKTDSRIAQLSQAANRIGDVVKLITAIAEQTNLLALNATIEAARAGEAGKGFAVVAQEVKALASQTAKATDEIGTQIAGMQTATQESVAAIKEIGSTIGHISKIASTIAAAVEEQGAATQEIANNAHHAAQGTLQVTANIADVNKGAVETGSASSHVLAAAGTLAGESTRLRTEVENFLATVRAA
jgi:methyl-accepting chemotaxis protein